MGSSVHLSAHYWRRRKPPVRIRLPPAHTWLLATTEAASTNQTPSSSHLAIGDDGSRQYESDSLQLTPGYWRRRKPPVRIRLPPAHTSLLATTEAASTDQTPSSLHLAIGDDGSRQYESDSLQLTPGYWRRRKPPVRIRLPSAHTSLLATTEAAS